MLTKIFIITLLLIVSIPGGPVMCQVNVTLSLSDKETGHPLRLPVRILLENGTALVPEGAEVPAIYLNSDGSPRPDAYIYVDGSIEFNAPEGDLTCEAAGAFNYHFYKSSHKISNDSNTISIALTPWREGDSLPQEILPIGEATVWTYASSLDGCLQAFRISIPADYDPLKPMPLRFLLHGHGGGKNIAPFADNLDRAPRDPNAVCVSPICRGDTHYQGMGEYEFFEIYNGLQKALAIDMDRVTVEGYSMGGAGTWHLAGRFPYLFSAAFPKSGYLDYSVFLWTARTMDEEGRLFRDGGYGRIVRQAEGERLQYWQGIRDRVIEDWEVPLYERQGTIGVLENTLNLPMFVTHGVYDMSIFGGVDVENSRRAWQRFLELGYDQKYYVELPNAGLGHGGAYQSLESSEPLKDDYDLSLEMAAISETLRTVHRNPWPRQVVLRTNTLEYNRNAWVEIDALDRHWRDTLIDVELVGESQIRIKTRNVRQFTIHLSRELVGDDNDVSVAINRRFRDVYPISKNRLLSLRFDDSVKGQEIWRRPDTRYPKTLSKRPEIQGPILHAFHRPHVYVVSSDESEKTAHAAAESLRDTNGGWLCSLMPCSQQYRPLMRRETDVKPWELSDRNIIVFGTPETSAILASRIDGLPISYSPNRVQFGVRAIQGEELGMLMVYPDPDQPSRYLVWCTPGIPPSVFAQLWHLPDFVVFEKDRIVFHGFFDEEWMPRND
ncbi:MAG: hypothetical protein ABIH23_20845 [bacterium]